LLKTTDISIWKVVECHIDVFPNSLYNKFGKEFLIETFSWYLINPDKRKLLSFERGNIVCGFLTMRATEDKDNFYRYIFPIFLQSIFRHPKAIINKKFFRKIFSQFIPNNNLVKESSSMELVSLGVRKQNRSEGIATNLLHEFERISKLYSYNKLVLSVRENNSNAIDFYLNHGWAISNRPMDNYLTLKKEL